MVEAKKIGPLIKSLDLFRTREQLGYGFLTTTWSQHSLWTVIRLHCSYVRRWDFRCSPTRESYCCFGRPVWKPALNGMTTSSRN